jgi:two-component system phosphate regulon sensor histidine kinase PhoR
MRIITYTVMFYMSLALIWWTVLLTKNNKELLKSKTELLDKTHADFKVNVAKLEKFHQRKARMILGEGLVFGCMLIAGLYVIQRMFNNELDSARRQKNFLLSITHELKSPIASVNLITETLQKRELDKPQRDVLLGNILSESKRLEKLINNLLLSAKLQSAYQYNFESTDLSERVKKQVIRYQNLFPDATIHLKSPAGVMVRLDLESFDSVIANVLENAIKYGGKSPETHVTISSINGNAIFEVGDEGPGISATEKHKIFDPFYRVGNEETRKSKGTGLGLYIANKIIKAHGGNIEVADNHPRGSLFRITLPLIQNDIT